MTNQELIRQISGRSWYQSIEFDKGIISKGCEWCGDPAWSNIVKLLPETLEDMRILDLGCNAGIFCVRSALMDAKEVIGVDYTEWRPNWDFEEQQVFVKNYFEQKFDRQLPITYISGKMEDVLKTDIGKFDYVYGIACLYYTETPNQVVRDISKITNKAIVRLRDENRVSQFRKLFKDHGFKESIVIQEKWWEKLNRKTDDFYLFLFEK